MKVKVKEFTIGLGAGLFIGGLFALLFAPASGKETRQKIAIKARDFKGRFKKATVDNIHGR